MAAGADAMELVRRAAGLATLLIELLDELVRGSDDPADPRRGRGRRG
jgi:hypothetical protein